jgi:hypothetical protein
MTRAEVVCVIQENGLESLYKTELSRATRLELETLFYNYLEREQTKKVSVTKVNTYIGCGLQYFYRYIRGYKIPPRGLLTKNSAIHATVEFDYNFKKIGEPRDLDDKREYYHTNFEYLVQHDGTVFDEQPRKVLETQGESTIKVHHKARENVRPVEVEQWYEEPLSRVLGEDIARPDDPFRDDRLVQAKLDFVEETEGIIDTKNAQRNWPEQKERLDLNFQMCLYSAIRGIRSVGVDLFYGEADPKYRPIRVTLQDNDIRRAMNKFRLVINAMDKGVYVPADPTSWQCSAKWCGYYSLCQSELLDN